MSRVVAIAVSALVVVAGCGNGAEKPADETPPEAIEAPIDVQILYDASSWTFEKLGRSVNVETNLYMDDDGRDSAQNVCKLTLGSVEDVDDVRVEGQNGVEFCERHDR